MGGLEENESAGYEAQESAEKAKEIRAIVKKSIQDTSKWRKMARESYAFYAGEQWTSDEQLELENDNRPAVVYNKVARTVNAVIGLESSNRYDITYEPFDIEDNGKAEIFTQTVKWVRDNCDAEDEESEMFEDSVICGYGFMYTAMDYIIEADGKVIQERVDPLEMAWDCDAKKKNLTDAAWFARIKRYNKKQFKAAFPDVDIETLSLGSLVEDSEMQEHITNYKDYDPADSGYKNSKKRAYDVIIYQCYEMETYYRVEINGQIQELSDDEFAQMKETLDAAGVVYTKQSRRKYKQYITCGDVIISEIDLKVGFTFKCITGLRDRNKGWFIGLVELMKDPQKWANKWLTQINYILSLNAKGGVNYETGALKNPQQAENDWANPSKMIEFNPGGLAKYQERFKAQYPDGLDRLLQYAMGAMNEVTGVNAEMLGSTDRYQAGYLERERKQAGVNILNKFFDAMRLYRKEQGRLLAEFVRNYLPEGTIVRVNDGPTKQYIPFTKDIAILKYDIVVDQSPYSTNMKERTYQILKEVLPTMLQTGAPVPPNLIRYLPLPESLATEWQQYIEEQSNSPEKQEAAQFEKAMKEAEIGEIQSKAMLNQAKAQQAGAQGQQGAVDLQTAMVGLHTAKMKAAADVQKANLGVQKAMIDMRKSITQAFVPPTQPQQNNYQQ